MTHDHIVSLAADATDLRQSLEDFHRYLESHGGGDKFARLVTVSRRLEAFFVPQADKLKGGRGVEGAK